MKEYRRFSLTNQNLVFNRIKALVLTLMLLLVLFPLGSFNGDKNVNAISGETIDFDLSYGNVEVGVSDGLGNYIYQGYDSTGAVVTGIHNDTNKYLVMQSNSTTITSNRIILTGFSPAPLYDITLSGINCASEANSRNGGIIANALNATPMEIILRLQDENYVGRIHYSTTGGIGPISSSLYITSALGDGFTDGTLTAVSTVAWSAAIGGRDETAEENSRNITIAGGTISATVQDTYGTSAIGGGGNGITSILISGGDVTAVNCGTGATIGGGGGQTSEGGAANVTITGGNVTAINNSPNGKAIGAGGSQTNIGENTEVTISGGTVTTTGSIGGGSSIGNAAGDAIVNISGGTVLVNDGGICGGNSNNSTGGSITVNITGGNVTAGTISGGIGIDETAEGNVSITGGSIIVETIDSNTAVVGSDGTAAVSMRSMTIPNISEITLVSDIVIEDGNGDTYLYGSDIYTDANGDIFIWLPNDCLVKSVRTSVDGIETDVTITSNTAGYTITIPDSFSVSDSSGYLEISTSIFNYLPSQQIQITLSLGACSKKLKLLGVNTETLDYSLYKDSEHTQYINPDDTVAVFSSNGTYTTRIYYTVDSIKRYSGSYSDTLTFNIDVIA